MVKNTLPLFRGSPLKFLCKCASIEMATPTYKAILHSRVAQTMICFIPLFNRRNRAGGQSGIDILNVYFCLLFAVLNSVSIVTGTTNISWEERECCASHKVVGFPVVSFSKRLNSDMNYFTSKSERGFFTGRENHLFSLNWRNYAWLMLAAARALVEQQPVEEDYSKFKLVIFVS